MAGDPDDPLVRAVLAGLEEEGVPSRVIAARDGACASAARGARTSPLEVGVAVVDGAVCLTHARFSEGSSVACLSDPGPTRARLLGQDAARIVLSVPLHCGVDPDVI